MFLGWRRWVLNVLSQPPGPATTMVIGTLKALGYSDMQVSWHFLEVRPGRGDLRGLVGLRAGYWMATGMTAMYRQFFQFPALESRCRSWNLYRDWHVGEHGLRKQSAVCMAAVRCCGSIRPRRCGRPLPQRRRRAPGTHRLVLAGLSSAWRMVLRNLLRARVRTLAAVFAAAMGASVMVNGFMMQEAMKYMIDFQFRKIMHNDLDLSFKDEHGEDVAGEARKLPGVDYVEPTLSVACKFTHGSHEKVLVLGLMPNARSRCPAIWRPSHSHPRPRIGHEPTDGRDAARLARRLRRRRTDQRRSPRAGMCPSKPSPTVTLACTFTLRSAT